MFVAFGLIGSSLLLGGLAWETGGWAPAPQSPQAARPMRAQEPDRVRYPPDQSPLLILPSGEARSIASMLRIDAPMQFGDYVWSADSVPPGKTWVRVDISRQIISIFRGPHEIGSAVILYGAEGKPTPAGRFRILQKAADYHSRTYDAPMPFMLRLTEDGVAIHGSDVREGRATHGCIGVPDGFARRLFAELQVGDTVFIQG